MGTLCGQSFGLGFGKSDKIRSEIMKLVTSRKIFSFMLWNFWDFAYNEFRDETKVARQSCQKLSSRENPGKLRRKAAERWKLFNHVLRNEISKEDNDEDESLGGKKSSELSDTRSWNKK